MFNRLVNHVDHTIFLKQMPDVQEVTLAIVVVEGLVLLVSYDSVLRVYPKFDVSEVDLVVPQVVIAGVN